MTVSNAIDPLEIAETIERIERDSDRLEAFLKDGRKAVKRVRYKDHVRMFPGSEGAVVKLRIPERFRGCRDDFSNKGEQTHHSFCEWLAEVRGALSGVGRKYGFRGNVIEYEDLVTGDSLNLPVMLPSDLLMEDPGENVLFMNYRPARSQI